MLTAYDAADQAALTAWNGKALFSMYGERASWNWTALVQVHDPGDVDYDGAPNATDCAPSDPRVRAVPGEVQSLGVTHSTLGAVLAWSSLAPQSGAGTTYDVIGGDLGALRTDGGFVGAACLANDDAAASWTDGGVLGGGGGSYYLVRGQNACGTGTYGHGAALDAGSPCP